MSIRALNLISIDISSMNSRIEALVGALQTLSTVTDVDYPTVRLGILQRGGDDFINGIRIALPQVRVVTTHEDGEATVEYVDADPFEVEKDTLIDIIKNVLQISYAVRWLTSA